MRVNLYHILISLSLTLTGLGSVYGQDTGAPNYDPYDPYADRERERVIYSPGESDPNSNKPIINTAKDSSSMRMPVQRNVKTASEPPKNANKPKEEDDSILSFNFLYYIIQKYKLQDIVD